MKKALKWICAFLAAAVLIALTAVISFKTAYNSFEDEFFLNKSNKISFNEDEVDADIISKFMEIKRRIETEYFLEYDENNLVEGAIKGMVDGLGDPYTKYYSAQEMKDRESKLQGEYVGTGISVSVQTEEYILVGSVKDDTPADYAEIKAGDRIVAIDGKTLAEYTNDEIWNMFTENGRTIVLSIIRGEESVEADLTVNNIVEQTVFSEMLDPQTGYIRISMFDANCSADFETEIDGLLKKGMKQLILDLRNNSGGLASEMSRIADSILPDGELMYYEIDRSGEKKNVKYSDAKALSIPIVVLVNGSTASAAEVMASMMRDSGSAELVGTKTYGKVAAQITVPFEDGTGLVFTVSQYYTKSGYNIQDTGLLPDKEIEPMEEYKNTSVQYIPRENDVQLNAALELLNGESDE